MTAPPVIDCSVVVVGAGFGGLTMAAELKKAGVNDFLVLESGSDVGGVWRENTYPGAACDVPSHLYSFAFDPHQDSRVRYPSQPAILDYMRQVTDRHDLRSHLRCNTAVVDAEYDETDCRWILTTARGQTIHAEAVVWAVGQLHRPATPQMPGAAQFAGRAFHSARWDHSADLTGHLAVVGTGSSAAQMIPELTATAASVTVYQRTPAWVWPKPAAAFGPLSRWALNHIPRMHSVYRTGIYRAADIALAPIMRRGWSARPAEFLARAHLRRQVPDRELRRKLTPTYRIGEKRVLMDSQFYPALSRPNVELVTDRIERLTADGILTADGTQRRADVIVWATGFRAPEFLADARIRGRGGVDLHDLWQRNGRPTAFYGMSAPGFPNLFMIAGPHSFTPANSNPAIKAHQVRYIMRCLALSDSVGAPVEVTEAAMAAYTENLDRSLARTVWPDGVAAWWKRADGAITNVWPGTAAEFERALAENEASETFSSVHAVVDSRSSSPTTFVSTIATTTESAVRTGA